MGEITPLFIIGMGRSGTTNALRVLNAHPQVMLNGEISLSVMKQFLDLLDGVEKSYRDKDVTITNWRARKADYMFESFGYLSKGGRGQLKKIPDARYRGHKTPRHESLFDRYEAHFGSSGFAPRYLYCARNPFDCWRSYQSVAWSGYKSVADFLAHYMTSFEQLAHMQRHAEGRVFVLSLDELRRAPDPLGWYRRRIFEPLGLDLDDRTARLIEKFGEEPQSQPPSNRISESDRIAISSHPGMPALLDRIFAGSAAGPLA
jgi:hypothetical protein